LVWPRVLVPILIGDGLGHRGAGFVCCDSEHRQSAFEYAQIWPEVGIEGTLPICRGHVWSLSFDNREGKGLESTRGADQMAAFGHFRPD
jgi:hypothetical protein